MMIMVQDKKVPAKASNCVIAGLEILLMRDSAKLLQISLFEVSMDEIFMKVTIMIFGAAKQ